MFLFLVPVSTCPHALEEHMTFAALSSYSCGQIPSKLHKHRTSLGKISPAIQRTYFQWVPMAQHLSKFLRHPERHGCALQWSWISAKRWEGTGALWWVLCLSFKGKWLFPISTIVVALKLFFNLFLVSFPSSNYCFCFLIVTVTDTAALQRKCIFHFKTHWKNNYPNKLHKYTLP